MYQFVDNLNEKEFEDFVFNSNQAHFMQSRYWGEVQKNKKFKPYLVGLKNNNDLVAVALILEKKVFRNIGYMYSPRGVIIDYSDKNLLKIFTKYLKTFVKSHNNMFLRIDPCIEYQNLDEDGNILETVNSEIINNLINLGFKHKGFNKNFENSQPRYTFRINIDQSIENIFKNFHPTTRKILNKGNQYNINIYKGNISDLEDFYLTMIETSKRENIIPSTIDYYKNFYEILNKENMSDIYIAKVNIKNLRDTYIKIIKKTEEQIKDITLNKKRNLQRSENIINDLNSKLEKMSNELNEINNIKQNEIVLSAIMTAKYKEKVWTVHGGNHNLLRWINANYLIYYEIIKNANQENYKIIDLFGTTGNPISTNPIYGIHLFKKRFGGKYTEFIGEFDLINKKLLYILYNKYIKYKKKKSH